MPNTRFTLKPGYDKYVVYTVFIILSTFAMRTANSAPLGLPENTAKIGYGVGAIYLVVDDPDGDTKNDWAFQPLTLIYSDWLISDIRYWSEGYYYKAVLDATDTDIGQDIQRYGIRFSAQKSFRIAKYWAPWFGGGFDVSNIDYSVRHTKDDDGFLIEKFPDRSELSVALLLNLVSEWSLARDWSISVKLEQSIPISGDVIDTAATMAVLYRY